MSREPATLEPVGAFVNEIVSVPLAARSTSAGEAQRASSSVAPHLAATARSWSNLGNVASVTTILVIQTLPPRQRFQRFIDSVQSLFDHGFVMLRG